MRFGADLKRATPSSPSEKANEATYKFVNDFVGGFESKDPNYVEKFFEDSDDIKVVMESVPPAEGKEAVKAVYEWMFKAEEHVIPDCELRSATAVGNQIMFTVEDPSAESKGKSRKEVRLHGIIEKSTIPGQEGKVRSFTLYGPDYAKNWVEGYEGRACGKRPDWAGKSRRK